MTWRQKLRYLFMGKRRRIVIYENHFGADPIPAREFSEWWAA